jgi:translocator protein
MAGLLLSLIGLYQKIKKRHHTFMDLAPFSIYLGWISVATITNIAYVLKNYNWKGFGLSDLIWTIILLLAASALGVIFRFKNDDWLYPLVFVWAFIGIGVKNAEGYLQLAYLSYVLAAILFIAVLIPLISRRSIRT